MYRTAHRLDLALRDAPLTRAEIRWGRATPPPLLGRRTTQVISRGKHLLHRLDGGITVHSHLRMEGQWRMVASATASTQLLARRDIRAVLGTADWTALGLRLGMLDVLPTDREGEVVGHLGPDLLGPDWDTDTALANLNRDQTRPVAEALLDQRNLAGLGTMYCAELLFLERVHPWCPVGDLAPQTLADIVARGHRLLHANVAHPVQTTTGSRRHGQTSYVHARSGLPCRRCGQTVRVATVGQPPRQRVMFSCPGCQGGPGPTDDGAPQRPLGSTPRSRARGYRSAP